MISITNIRDISCVAGDTLPSADVLVTDGTEKQNKWATEIVLGWIARVDRELDYANHALKICANENDSPKLVLQRTNYAKLLANYRISLLTKDLPLMSARSIIDQYTHKSVCLVDRVLSLAREQCFNNGYSILSHSGRKST